MSPLHPSRREIIRGAVGIAAGSFALGSFPGASSAQSTPKKGGRLRVGLGGGSTTDSMDPMVASATLFAHLMNGHVRNTLVNVDAKAKAVPALAENWEPQPGAQVWRFKIRKGVTFHDGRPFTAKDVIWTVNYHRGAESSSPLKQQTSEIESMEVDGDYLVFKLKSGNADFPYLFADSRLAIGAADMSKADWDKDVGTGPFKLVEWAPGVRALLRRNENYWRTDGGPYFDEVEVIAINDGQARINALLSNQVDVINRVDPRVVGSLKANSAVKVVAVTGDYQYSMAARTDLPPFDNVDVRLAVKYAMDRELVLKNVLHGLGDLGNDHPISKRNEFFNTELPQRKFDPDKAKFHLKKSGFTGKLPAYTVAPVHGGAVDLAVILQQSARKAGIEIEIEQVPNDGYFQNVWKKRPWFCNYSSGRPTADGILTLVYAKGVRTNETNWENERFNDLLKQARVETDQSKRRDMYWECQKLINEDGGTIIPVFPQFVDAASSRLMHGDVAGDRELDGAKIGERWWFA